MLDVLAVSGMGGLVLVHIFLFPSFSLEHGYVNGRDLYSDCFWSCILSVLVI